MREIPLVNGRGVALVDDEDYALVARYRWRFKEGYASTYVRNAAGERSSVTMHVLLMGTQPGKLVDHRNRNRLDNRRSNLRWATTQQNNANRAVRRDCSAGYKGVQFDTKPGRTKPWRALIVISYRRQSLGYYATAEEAARAYDRKAIELHGDYAHTNFPLEEYAHAL